MAALLDTQIVEEFSVLDIEVKKGSTVLDRLADLSRDYNLEPSNLCNEWVAFSQQQNGCELEALHLDRFETALRSKSRKTPLSRRTGSKAKGNGTKMYTKDDLGSLFGDDIIGQYATPEDTEKLKSQKRAVEQTTPTTPASKVRYTENGATPLSRPHPQANGATPTNGHSYNGTPSTPYNSTPSSGKYSQRHSSGRVVASLNDCTVSVSWRGEHRDVVARQLGDNPLRESEQYMFQKVTEKALALIDRIETFGRDICAHNGLADPQPVGAPSLESAVFTGQVVCEGEGHLNARSCLLEGPIGRNKRTMGSCVRVNIPDNVPCSLFPGQVVAVEGINNYHGGLIPSRIYDEGVPLPSPQRQESSIAGFTMLTAVGPFTTSDNLDYDPLRDLLEVIKKESPNVVILMGPFIDSSHENVKKCQVPGDLLFSEFFKTSILKPIHSVCSGRSKVILIPSQRDTHHPYCVYPQPPLVLPPARDTHSFSDPATLSLNGVCVGLTSTDVLFHLSARTMFKGPFGDRMAKIASHVLKQRCYYPLLPAFRRDDHANTTQSKDSRETPVNSANQTSVSTEIDKETTEVNVNLIDAIENGHALLTVRPDILILPSDLKPFIKVLDGCVCINPGRLTKRTTGGTYMKVIVPDLPGNKTDLSSNIGVEIVHI